MEVEYLREFTVVAKMESFSRAAEELCISQSALSKHILALERELGAPLLIRNSRNVSISPAGAQILPLAAQIYELSNRIKVAADKECRRGRTFLKIGSIPVMAQYNITGALARFQKRHPEITLEVDECEQHDLLSRIRDGSYELAFTRIGTATEPDMDYHPFCRDHLVAVMHRDHPLATAESLTLSQLKDESLLWLDSRTGLFPLCTDLFSTAGITPHIVYTGHRPENIVELAAQNMGIAILMRRHTDYLRSPDVACVDISPRVDSTICLIHRSDSRLSAPAVEFIRMLEEYAAD